MNIFGYFIEGKLIATFLGAVVGMMLGNLAVYLMAFVWVRVKDLRLKVVRK